jgi:hypothetical protein
MLGPINTHTANCLRNLSDEEGLSAHMLCSNPTPRTFHAALPRRSVSQYFLPVSKSCSNCPFIWRSLRPPSSFAKPPFCHTEAI